jgi:hypothetical protein
VIICVYLSEFDHYIVPVIPTLSWPNVVKCKAAAEVVEARCILFDVVKPIYGVWCVHLPLCCWDGFGSKNKRTNLTCCFLEKNGWGYLSRTLNSAALLGSSVSYVKTICMRWELR